MEEALNLPDSAKNLFFSSKEPRDDCDCFQHLQGWIVAFHSLNVPSGFHLDGSPLLNAHSPVRCSSIDGSALFYWSQQGQKGIHCMQWLHPTQLTTWKLQNASTNPVICWILDLPFSWSFPSQLCYHTRPTKNSMFPALASVFLSQVWFLMHAKVSLRPGCHYCPQTVPEESQLPTADKVQAWLSSKKFTWSNVDVRDWKKYAVIIVLLKHNGSVLFLCGTKSASVIHTYCVGNMVSLKPVAGIWSIRLFKKSNKNLVLFKD